MKKEYIAPETETIDIDTAGVLCSSPLEGGFGNVATTPAKAPMFDDWLDEDGDR